MSVAREQQEEAIKKFLSPENDRQSRHNWSITVACIIVNNWDVDKLWDCVNGGYSRFLSIARGSLSQHGFKEEDYRRIWHIIEKTARMNSDQRKRFSNNLIVEATRG